MYPVLYVSGSENAGADALRMMFAEAHRLAVDSFEQRLDHNPALLTERLERRLAEQTSSLLKWSFLFWITQVAAIAGMLSIFFPAPDLHGGAKERGRVVAPSAG